jgi:hypothetical protein
MMNKMRNNNYQVTEVMVEDLLILMTNIQKSIFYQVIEVLMED